MKKGQRMSDEQRIKVGNANRGRVHSAESRKNMSVAHLGQISWAKGKTFSEEYRKKLSISHMGIKQTNIQKENASKRMVGNTHALGYRMSEEERSRMSKRLMGHPSYTKGMKHTIETRAKMRISHLGPLAPAWKGGVTLENNSIRNSLDSKIWKEGVRERDDWICQKTMVRGGRLEVHHIKNFSNNPDLRFDINNGITLSIKSHKEFHRTYGNKNNTLEQIEEFIGRKLDIPPAIS